jgi:GDP-mannose pyrophosphatase NudK
MTANARLRLCQRPPAATYVFMKNDSYRIISSEIMAKGWSQLLRLTVAGVTRQNREVELIREVADHGHGASVLPIDPVRGTCLLVKQWRAGAAFAGHDGWMIEACAGLLDTDDPIGCATREAMEELGTGVRNLVHISDCFASPGAFSERLSLFIAEYNLADRVNEGGGRSDEDEDIEVLEMPLKTAFTMIATGEIQDAKTIILLQHAMLNQMQSL